jgi:exopolysaccharide biosynthesis polyprenyl glycosylphosphotransferase
MLLLGTRPGGRADRKRESNLVVDASRAELPHTGAKAERLRAHGEKPSAWRVARRRGWLVRRMLVLADLIGLALAFLTVELLFAPAVEAGSSVRMKDFLLSLISLPLWIVIAKIYRLYDQDEERTHHSTSDDIVGVFHVVTIGTWVTFVALTVTGYADPSLGKAIGLWVFAILFIVLARTVARTICRRNPLYLQNTLIVGAGDIGQRVARKLLRHPEYGFNLVGFVDSKPKERHADLGHLALLGPPSLLEELVSAYDIERVVVAFSNDTDDETLAAVRALNDLEIQVDVVPRLFELVGASAKIDTLEGLPLVELPPLRLPRSSRLLKRAVDLIGASIGLLLTAPLFAFFAVAIKLDSRGPVFFRQERLGKDQRTFTTLKFRTMRVGVDTEVHRHYIKTTMHADQAANGNGLYKLERLDAVTRVGRWLRATSLDELPQLINVFRGDMSLVGPRPCIPYETEYFRPHHFERFLVPAGLTGLWQVTARAHSTFGEALDMDVAYVRGWSLGLDLRLLCRTPLTVLARRGAA